MRHLTTCYIVLCAMLTPFNDASAQGKITLRFLAFPKQLEPQPVELMLSEGKTMEVDTPGHELSRTYQIPPLSAIVVGKTSVNDKGETVFNVYGKSKAIAATNQIILLMRKGKEPIDGFEVIPIDAGQSNFTGGSYWFINSCTLNVGGTIGDQKFALKPGQQKLLKPKPDQDGGVCQVTLAYERPDKWKEFYDTRWPANPRFRSLVFFYQDPSNGRLGVAPIIDILPN